MNKLDSERLRSHLEQSIEARERFEMNHRDWEYVCMEDFVLREGQPFFERSPREDRYQRGMWKACFWNARRLAARSHGRLRYVEGFAMTKIPIPCLHAWCIDDEDRVVDITWKGSISETEIVGTAYWGVVFPIEFVKATQTQENGSMIDRWHEGWPIMQNKWRVDTVPART